MGKKISMASSDRRRNNLFCFDHDGDGDRANVRLLGILFKQFYHTQFYEVAVMKKNRYVPKGPFIVDQSLGLVPTQVRIMVLDAQGFMFFDRFAHREGVECQDSSSYSFVRSQADFTANALNKALYKEMFEFPVQGPRPFLATVSKEQVARDILSSIAAIDKRIHESITAKNRLHLGLINNAAPVKPVPFAPAQSTAAYDAEYRSSTVDPNHQYHGGNRGDWAW